MLTFDPTGRITVVEALEHPWLASYHDIADEPECSRVFDKWHQIEEIQTIEEFREAIWNEIEEYRKEVRGVSDLSGVPIRRVSGESGSRAKRSRTREVEPDVIVDSPAEDLSKSVVVEEEEPPSEEQAKRESSLIPPTGTYRPTTPTDPLVSYAGARRSSILQQHSRQGSAYSSSPVAPSQALSGSYTEGSVTTEPGSLPQGGIVFPTQGYIVPARSRTGSTVGGEVTRRLLRTLSTVSIHESLGDAADVPPIGKFIVEKQTTDAPPSEMPREFGINEEDEGGSASPSASEKPKDGKFILE